jgi:hypothetical protein
MWRIEAIQTSRASAVGASHSCCALVVEPGPQQRHADEVEVVGGHQRQQPLLQRGGELKRQARGRVLFAHSFGSPQCDGSGRDR